MMQYNMMLAQQQQAQYMNANQSVNDLQMIVPEAEQIARAIYAAVSILATKQMLFNTL